METMARWDLAHTGHRALTCSWVTDRCTCGLGRAGNATTTTGRDMSQGSMATEQHEDAAARQRREIAAAVHELRTPLATVQGLLETLVVRGDQLDADARDHIIGIALRNAVLLGQRIDTLLEYERFAMDEAEVAPAPAPLYPSVARIVEDCAGLLADHEVVIEVPSSTVVELDGTALAHVLGNLLDNAAKHSPPGSLVTVQAIDDGSDVLVRVRDEGQGIDPDDLPRVFEAFYRGRDRRRGTGLGLSVARCYVEAWGGTLTIDSTLGVGTVVTFSLPSADAVVDVTDQTVGQ